MDKERHGFLTFWFGLMIFSNVMIIILFLAGAGYSWLFGFNQSNSSRVLYIITPILNCVSAVLLYCWSILGFILWIISQIIGIIVEPGGLSIVTAIIAIGFLFALLQLKKNDISCWAYLTERLPQNNIIKKDSSKPNALKCNSCQKTFSSGYGSCPYCSSKNISTNENYVSHPQKINYGDTWTCKKCNEENPVTASACKGCGEYK